MDTLKEDVVVTMCMLEMTMPPMFFHIMMHLVLHLLEEVHMCGLAHKSWCIALNKWIKFWKGILGIPHALRLFDGGKIFHGQKVSNKLYCKIIIIVITLGFLFCFDWSIFRTILTKDWLVNINISNHKLCWQFLLSNTKTSYL